MDSDSDISQFQQLEVPTNGISKQMIVSVQQLSFIHCKQTVSALACRVLISVTAPSTRLCA
jgi:hypothetical protein